MYDHAIRMYAHANQRISDAEILSRSLDAQSDSAALLNILGFEVLLKCGIMLAGQTPKENHNYSKLWAALPGAVSKEILSAAAQRMPAHADLSDLSKLLKAYQFVFEKGRYYYEFFRNYSLKEQFELGEVWLELGAPVDEAIVQYFPNELFCLIHGLRLYIERRLGERKE